MLEQKLEDRVFYPLVSIVVITYNSSEYLLKTLDSIEKQTYQNLELIVSDDCSTDSTVEIAQKWLTIHEKRFCNAQIVGICHNSGIPANANRGISATHGEWVKIIAGDDLLLPDCIKILMSEVSPEKDILIGLVQNFYQRDGMIVKCGTVPVRTRYFFFEKDAKFQHKYLLTKSFNFSPGAFVRKSLYQDLDYYDERFKLLEDLPFWLKATAAGRKIYLCKRLLPCVLYRTRHESCSFTSSAFFNVNFYNCLQKYYKKVIYKEISYFNIVFYESELIHKMSYLIIIKLFRNKRNRYTKMLNDFMEYFCLTHYVYPLFNYYYRRKDSGK